jgi:hypothetical protein
MLLTLAVALYFCNHCQLLAHPWFKQSTLFTVGDDGEVAAANDGEVAAANDGEVAAARECPETLHVCCCAFFYRWAGGV